MMSAELSPEQVATLSAEHGRLVFAGRQGMSKVYFRLPSLQDITLVRSAKDDTQRRIEIAALAKRACVYPNDVSKLFRDKPALAYSLGMKLLQASGMGGSISVLDEHEVPEEMAEAYAKHASPKTHALKMTSGSVEFLCLLVEPNEAQLNDYYDHNHDAEAMKALLKKLCKFGDSDSLETKLPGAYSTLVDFLVEKSGLTLDFVMGEA